METGGVIWPIGKLTPYVANWTIKVRVTSKTAVKNFHGRRGPGKVFNVHLLDDKGTEIQAAMFNEAVDKFYELFQVGKMYYVSRGTIRPVNKKFREVNNNYELLLDTESTVTEVTGEDANIQVPVERNFVRIDQVYPYINNDSLFDVIGIVCDVLHVRPIKRKRDNQEVAKRDITILDESEQTVKVSLWGSLATKDGEELLEAVNEHPIVEVTKVRASSFQGVSLSTTPNSVVNIRPNIQRAADLESWYKSQKNKGRYVSAGMVSSRTVLSDINSLTIENGESAYFNVRATVTFIDPKQVMWYEACVSCKKKPVDLVSTKWCDKCQHDTETCKRYVFQVTIADHTGETTVTMFNEQAEELLGYTAEQLSNIRDKEQDYQMYLNVLEKATWVMKIFRICVVHSEYRGYQTTRVIVRDMAAVDWGSESNLLCKELKRNQYTEQEQ